MKSCQRFCQALNIGLWVPEKQHLIFYLIKAKIKYIKINIKENNWSLRKLSSFTSEKTFVPSVLFLFFKLTKCTCQHKKQKIILVRNRISAI